MYTGTLVTSSQVVSVLYHIPCTCILILLQFDLDSMWTFMFGEKPGLTGDSVKLDLCPEAAICILAMVRAMLNQVSASSTNQGFIDNWYELVSIYCLGNTQQYLDCIFHAMYLTCTSMGMKNGTCRGLVQNYVSNNIIQCGTKSA